MTEINFNELLKESAGLYETARGLRRLGGEIPSITSSLTAASVYNEEIVFLLRAAAEAVQEEAHALNALSEILDGTCRIYSKTENDLSSPFPNE